MKRLALLLILMVGVSTTASATVYVYLGSVRGTVVSGDGVEKVNMSMVLVQDNSRTDFAIILFGRDEQGKWQTTNFLINGNTDNLLAPASNGFEFLQFEIGANKNIETFSFNLAWTHRGADFNVFSHVWGVEHPNQVDVGDGPAGPFAFSFSGPALVQGVTDNQVVGQLTTSLRLHPALTVQYNSDETIQGDFGDAVNAVQTLLGELGYIPED